ncbi:aldehyde dehydrogenase family protein [Rhodanobacter sp. BL-MT-08]
MKTQSENALNALARYDHFDKQSIGGENVEGRGKGTTKVSDPFTGLTLCEIHDASIADVDAAFNAAKLSQKSWEKRTPAERGRVLLNAANIMDARKEEIIVWLIRESGSTRIKARLEWQAVRDMMVQFSALPYQATGEILPSDVPGKENRVYRRPLGVVSVISPWNWPLHLTTRSVAPALALGNSVVIKPAGETPITGGLLLARIFQEAGLPDGVLNVVVGHSSEIGDAFVLHPDSPFISFTGSSAVGRRIGSLAVTGTILKRAALELGGNAPLVVLSDADVDQAINAAVLGKFLHQGQICVATNRIIVEAAIYDDFVAGYIERVASLKFGDPNDEDTIVGPVISKKRLDALQKMVQQAQESGATIALGGSPLGLVLPPHILTEVATSSAIANEEIFGPLAPIIRVANSAAAIDAANQSEFGLSSAIFTRDVERGVRFAHQIDAGMTHINDVTSNDAPNTPFGGEKNSGIGRFGSKWVIEEMTRTHWVSVQHSPREYPF